MIGFKRISYSILLSKSLILISLFIFLIQEVKGEPALCLAPIGFQNCKEIDVSYQVINNVNGDSDKSIVLDLKGIEKTTLIISLVGPNKLFLNDIPENEIRNLKKGTYSLVIVGRNESSGYCPRHFQVIIK